MTSSAGDVARALYRALGQGDVAGTLDRLAEDVILDEPPELPWGGVHRGHDAFVGLVLAGMTAGVDMAIAEVVVIAGEDGEVVGRLSGTFTARATGESIPVTMVELLDIVGDKVTKVDVYTKDPAALAAFYARAAVSPEDATPPSPSLRG
jgi:ketosteroid isomerase-like protein